MTEIDDSRAKRNVAVLVAAQAFLGSQITMMFWLPASPGSRSRPMPVLRHYPFR